MTQDSKKRESAEDSPLEGEPDAKKVAVEEKKQQTEEKKDDDNDDAVPSTLKELASRFPSLPLENSSVPFLGLYFGASWCPDVQKATPAVEKFCSEHKDDVHVVYVASDSTEEQMKDFVPSCMSTVPFDNKEERASLKRHFGTCAGKEREELGMTTEDRKYGIPTLVILDTTTGNTVTMDGVEDIVNGSGDSVVEKWKALLK